MYCKRDPPIFYTLEAHNSRRDVKFPMLSGMEPVNWLRERSLHPNVYTSQVTYEIQSLPHLVRIAFCNSFITNPVL